MHKRTLSLARAGALVSTFALAAPLSATADIFAWRTEDGVFAYTDDRDKIPSRYADEAVAVRDSRLDAYRRLTIEDTRSTREVASRMEKRLDYLRQVNAPALAHHADAASAERSVVSVPMGFAGHHGADDNYVPGQLPTLDIATGASSEPIVVEPVLTKQDNRARTRRATIVKQGDRTLAVIKGRSHHVDINSDILDEDELLEPR